jgi:hypothetical protein
LFARGAFERYQLPDTIVRPFNCTGVGEACALRNKEVVSSIIGLAMSPPFEYDVQYRVPDVTKAKSLLGLVGEVTLQEVVDEVVAWCRREMEAGRL